MLSEWREILMVSCYCRMFHDDIQSGQKVLIQSCARFMVDLTYYRTHLQACTHCREIVYPLLTLRWVSPTLFDYRFQQSRTWRCTLACDPSTRITWHRIGWCTHSSQSIFASMFHHSEVHIAFSADRHFTPALGRLNSFYCDSNVAGQSLKNTQFVNDRRKGR